MVIYYQSLELPFLINVPFAVLAVVAGVFLLPEARVSNPPRWDAVATGLSIFGMGGIVWGIKELAKNGWETPSSWLLLVGGVLLMGLFVWRCLNRPDPLLDVRLFRSAPFTAGTVAALASSFAMGGVLLLVAQWLQIVAGFPPLRAGLALLPMALGSFLTAPFAPALAGRIGARTVLGGGLTIASVGLFILAGGDLDTYADVVLPLVLVGAGVGSLAIATAIIMGSTPTDKAGNAAAIEESMYDVGNVLGVAVLGSVADSAYRSGFVGQETLTAGVDAATLSAVKESLVGALHVAEQVGLPELARLATDAYADGIAQAALVGGVLLVAAAGLAFLLVPRNFDLNEPQRERGTPGV